MARLVRHRPTKGLEKTLCRLLTILPRPDHVTRTGGYRVAGGSHPPPAPTERSVRICQVDQPLLAFTPADPGVRSYRTGLLWKVTCGLAATLCQD
jgi:hypothetical protein